MIQQLEDVIGNMVEASSGDEVEDKLDYVSYPRISDTGESENVSSLLTSTIDAQLSNSFSANVYDPR